MSRLRREEGLSLIEVLVSSLIIFVGLVATVGAVEASRRQSTVDWRAAAAAQAGEAELQRVEATRTWANLALRAAPTKTSASDTSDPTYYESSCSSTTCYQPDQSAGGSTATEKLVIDATNGDATANPQTTTVPAPTGSTGAMTLKVYRFITTPPSSFCNACRRITIAVKNVDGYPRNPVLVTSVVMDKTTQNSNSNPLNMSGATCTYAGSSDVCTP